MDPLLTPIKGRSRALVREGWPRERTGRRVRLSHTNACNPLLQAHPTWAQGNTKAAGFPLLPVSFPPPFVLRLAPTHLGWDTRRQFTRRFRDPPGRNADRSCLESTNHRDLRLFCTQNFRTITRTISCLMKRT
jgi:hypothetical protein